MKPSMPSAVINRVGLRTPQVVVGEFRCPVSHPSFGDSGPISDHIVVFPRTSVWIRHEGSSPFIADPTIATIYSRGQRYVRGRHAEAGDRCDWFGASDALAREIVASFDPRAAECAKPFVFQRAASDTRLYVRQRRLLRRAISGELDSLEIEEEVVSIIAAVLRSAYGTTRRPVARRAACRHAPSRPG